MNVSEQVIPALLLTVFAGLSTGIGSAIAYFIKKPKIVYLSFSLGFSAGVMIYISFMELMPQAIQSLGNSWAVLAFFWGIAVVAIIDLLIPEPQNPHSMAPLAEWTNSEETCELKTESSRLKAGSSAALMRTGLFTALAVGIHNFPEGLATFASALSDVHLGVFIAIAIAIHNVPEGIAVSVPIFYATSNKNKAFFYSFLSGLSEPIGAIVGYLILLPFLTPGLLAALLAFVAGIMIYISLDELLPLAHRYGHGHLVIAGIVLGMLVMAISLVIL
jgi:ZIP family zinc transporter